MLDKLHAERLLQVVRVLDELPKEKKFDLLTWLTCGTVGCAVGWAASDPWFTRRGLKMVYCPDAVSGSREYEPHYKNEESDDAVRTFFDLDSYEIQELFYKTSYASPTKRNVIRRIKAFVKDNT